MRWAFERIQPKKRHYRNTRRRAAADAHLNLYPPSPAEQPAATTLPHLAAVSGHPIIPYMSRRYGNFYAS